MTAGPAIVSAPGGEVRWEVPTPELLQELIGATLPLGLRSTPPVHIFHRDVFLDTDEGSLREQGLTCRFRLTSDDRRILTLSVREPAVRGRASTVIWQRYDAATNELDPLEAARGTSEPARRLHAMIDPARLRVDLAFSTERHVRCGDARFLRRGRFEFVYDAVTVEQGPVRRRFHEMKARRLVKGRPSLAAVAEALQARYDVRPTIVAKIDRARQLRTTIMREAELRSLDRGGLVALVAVEAGRVACRQVTGELRLPTGIGSGEGAARHLLSESFGSGVGELRLLGTLPASAARPRLEVWLAGRQRRQHDAPGASIEWLSIDELTTRAGTTDLTDPATIAALLVAARAGALATRAAMATMPSDRAASAETPGEPTAAKPRRPSSPNEYLTGTDRLLDGSQSLLEFNSRVLAMAEDPRTPLLERLRYVAIVSMNLDELFMVRVSALKRRVLAVTGERSVAERTPDEQLADLRERIEALTRRQERACTESLAALAAHGVGVVRLDEGDAAARLKLREYFRTAIQPALTPHAITEAPGYPTPRVASGALSLLVVIKDPQTGPLHLASLRIPPSLPRFVRVPDARTFVPIEELVRDEVDALYPGRAVIQAHVFRATRAGEIDVNEAESGNLLQAIEEDTRRRLTNPIVRVEVERSMPQQLRGMLLQELRLDASGEQLLLGPSDVYESSPLVDFGALRELAELPLPELRFPPFQPVTPFREDTSIVDAVRERDRLVHLPYEDFDATVLRFLDEAAADPAVITIKATLYRAGGSSPVVDSLVRAAEAGKEVVTFVELKARFDEERNAQWARRLTSAGAHVIYGLVGLKNHAKMILVVRREGDGVRKYAQISTGNYHAANARVYTDLGLFTADDELTADVSDLFNELTGSSQWPRGSYRRLLVAPHQLLTALIARVHREIAHVRAGRGGRIRLKLNGISDLELIDSLYEASQAGVDIDLIVRGLCLLRPGVPGLSERIRVTSLVGRFLEHARIYHFGNGGDEEYFIGSADWRARNVRRRIEVVAPISDPACRQRLEQILERELNDASAWVLRADGRYERAEPVPTPGSEAQLLALAETALAREAVAS
jgi:polyphosphate kinase